MAASQELALTELLSRAGARIRGRGRADCPRCKRHRTVSFDESKSVYYCHGAACDFSGSYATLARELGLARRLTAAEYRELRENRERADRGARDLYERVRARRFELLECVRRLGQLELSAHQAGADHPATWGALALVYRERPALLAELAILENSCAADLIRFLSASPKQRAEAIDEVLMRGGLYESHRKFLDLAL
jgi:hypothetical protein